MDFQKLIEYLDSKFATFKEELLAQLVTKEEFRKGYDKLDIVIGELQTVRQEQAMHTGSHQRVDETLESHDKRIKKLESSPIVAHTLKK